MCDLETLLKSSNAALRFSLENREYTRVNESADYFLAEQLVFMSFLLNKLIKNYLRSC